MNLCSWQFYINSQLAKSFKLLKTEVNENRPASFLFFSSCSLVSLIPLGAPKGCLPLWGELFCCPTKACICHRAWKPHVLTVLSAWAAWEFKPITFHHQYHLLSQPSSLLFLTGWHCWRGDRTLLSQVQYIQDMSKSQWRHHTGVWLFCFPAWNKFCSIHILGRKNIIVLIFIDLSKL